LRFFVIIVFIGLSFFFVGGLQLQVTIAIPFVMRRSQRRGAGTARLSFTLHSATGCSLPLVSSSVWHLMKPLW